MKRELERLDFLRSQAEEVIVEADAGHFCAEHRILVKEGDGDSERRAYALGTQLVKRGKVDGTREEFMKAIHDVLMDSWIECSECVRERHEDN
jgi:hypothetical protein